MSIYSIPQINTWEDYKNLVKNHKTDTESVIKKYGNTPPPGSLAYPGDLQLIEKYGTTVQTIYDKLMGIINDTQKRIQEQIEAQKNNNSNFLTIPCDLNDQYKVKASYKFSNIENTSPCSYCRKILLRNQSYEITNKLTNKTIAIPFVMLHLLQHNDLGDTGVLSINPRKICKVLGLGKMPPPTDPLHLVSKHCKLNLSEIQTLEFNNFVKYKNTVGSFMMRNTSGRK